MISHNVISLSQRGDLMFSEQLKIIRKAHKMSQKDVAAYLGVGQTTIANYEKGIRLPNQITLKELAILFNTSVDLLIGEINEPKRAPFTTAELIVMKERYLNLLLLGKEAEAVTMIESLATSKNRIIDLIESVIVQALYGLGQKWQDGIVDVAREHYGTEISRKIVTSIGNKLSTGIQLDKKAICLTLYTEEHHIGLLIISEYLKAMGYQTYYIGGNTPTDAVLKIIEEIEPDLIAFSITLENHVEGLKDLVKIIREHASKKQFKIIAGGQGIKGDFIQGIDGIAKDYTGLNDLIHEFSNK